MKRLPYNALIQYFDLDLDNCLLTRTDLCNVITDFINNPEKARKAYLDELKTWINDRADAGYTKPINTHDEVFEFWNPTKEIGGNDAKR